MSAASRSFCALFLALWASLSPAAAAPAPARSPYQLLVQPGAGPGPVLSLIRQAKHSIRLELYLLTQQPVIDALAQARRRGVQVRVLLEERPYGGDASARSAYHYLQQAGINVRWANEAAFRFTHEKALIVDTRTAGIFSFNLTYSGLERNREFGVIDRNRADAATLARVFDADWVRKRPAFSSPRLVVSPYNARGDFDKLIARARHTLDIYAEELDDSSIELRLDAAKKRGVRVRVITTDDSGGVEALRVAGIPVTLMAHPYVHAKAMVADGHLFFVGSENISTTSLDDNREAGILLDNRALAGRIERVFNADWAANRSSGGTAPPPPPPTGHHGALSVRVSASPTSVRRGQELTIRAQTSPGAACTVRVTYPDGYVSRARSLAGTRLAGGTGTVSWSWHEGSTVSGVGHASVTCTLRGQTGQGTASFTIQ